MDKGAHYYCCDFQVHTPRDRQWQGEGAVTANERQTYAIEFVAACRERGINAVAITDHHDMALVPFIRQAAQSETDEQGQLLSSDERLVVFPGMELTLGIPCQALILFDANFPDDLFSLVKNALAIQQVEDEQAKTCEVDRLIAIKSFSQLYQELDKHTYLQGRYVVFPNVSEGGSSTMLRSGHSGHYRDMPCVGGYVDGSCAKLGQGNRDILNGKASQYGNKALGLFQTSDNRRRDFADLGKHVTWVKWAAPTAEALRQACLARESRIAQETPFTPSVVISSVSISNSKFLGPLALEFNPQYNAIIGGRGTGKSTILEYVRWALCDEPSTFVEESEETNYSAKQRKLIEKTLTVLDANVQINFLVNGVSHSVRRHAKSHEVLLKIGNGPFQPCSEADVRRILPIQAYGQKQLSSVGVRLEELKRFVDAPVRQQFDDLSRVFRETASGIRTEYARLQKKLLAQRDLENDQRELRSLSEQVAVRRAGLTGMRPQDQDTIDKKTWYEDEEEVIQGWLGNLGQTEASILEAIRTVRLLAPSPQHDHTGLPNEDLVNETRLQVLELFSSVEEALSQAQRIISVAKTPRQRLSINLETLNRRREEFLVEYQEAKGRSTAHEATLAELTGLEVRAKALRDRIVGINSSITAIGHPEEPYSELRNKWRALYEERSALLRQQCNAVTGLSDGLIRVTLQQCGVTTAVEEKLKSIIAGANIRSNKVEDLCRGITSKQNPMDEWGKILDELEQVALYEAGGSTKRALPPTPLLLRAGLTENDVSKMAAKLTPDMWLELSLFVLDDHPIFQYRAREGEYIPFADASAGQQATALLWALLNQDGPPLIIDQPEDDLDNQVILKIVGQIWKAKTKRQILFSSHNANLVVNGDSELVICCDYRVTGEQSSGNVKHEGAIDVGEIRDAIANIMEGGRDAFTLRRDKYGF